MERIHVDELRNAERRYEKDQVEVSVELTTDVEVEVVIERD